MIIRNAETKDAARIAELLIKIAHLHHLGRPDIYAECAKYSAAEVKEMLCEKGKKIFVAVDGKDFVLGYIICIYKERDFSASDKKLTTLYVDDLCVDEKYRGQKIGKSLLMYAKETAIKDGCFNLELNAWAFNKNAVEFYKSCGMEEQRYIMEFKL